VTDLAEQLNLIDAREENNEWRIFGPPGTGKTTHTSRQVKKAVEKYGPDRVLITSFSRAAAAELCGRDLPVAKDKIGTLHAHCYRALSGPVIAETKVADWNQQYPHWAIKGNTENDLDEPLAETTGNTDGDHLLAAVNRWRNRMMPVEAWGAREPELKRFYDAWCRWKASNGLIDFTDLLERASLDCRIAPGDPRVIFADEAQDFTRLQLNLIRTWGKHTDYFLTVGDDDQTIYTFTGATPDAFLRPEVPPEQKIVLSQSWRVPQAVHARAIKWIEQVRGREPKEYRPTKEAGVVEHFGNDGNYDHPEDIITAAEKEIAAGRSVMFLTACSYMLNNIRRVLAERGIPYHNPYRRRRGDWNPLFAAKGITAADRLLAFIKPHNSQGDAAQPWTAEDYRKWADWVEAAKAFQRGGKTAAKDMRDDDAIDLDMLHEWLKPEAYDDLMKGIMTGALHSHLMWWFSRVSESHKKTAAYPLRVTMVRGIAALRERPQVIIGTIHSVKGGEADVVYLFPDLSRAADAEWYKGGEFRDAIIRQFYVGMTRAKHKLVLCNSVGPYTVRGL
jgi:superfamily I DNA/RNA helicase